MRDRGISQYALHVVLQEREEVTGKHGSDGDDREHQNHGREAMTETRLIEVAKQQREHSAFRNRGNEGCHRRRRPLINIRRPHVERHQGEFEADAGDNQRHAGQQQCQH